MTVSYGTATIDWLGYATLRWEADAGPVIYADPGRYGVLTREWAEEYGERPHPRGDPYAPGDADLVLVTHDHHYDDDGVDRVAGPDTTIIVHEAVDAARITEDGRPVEPPESLSYDVVRIDTGETVNVADATVEAIPAYNHADGPNVRADGTPIHPPGTGCGFTVGVDGVRWCWTGDSDRLDIHDTLEVDVLFPSIARTITMDRHDAAAIARELEPSLVVPVHYNTFDGLAADSRAFAADVASAGIPVALDERSYPT